MRWATRSIVALMLIVACTTFVCPASGDCGTQARRISYIMEMEAWKKRKRDAAVRRVPFNEPQPRPLSERGGSTFDTVFGLGVLGLLGYFIYTSYRQQRKTPQKP